MYIDIGPGRAGPGPSMNNPKTMLRVGVVGSVLVALCCFTPILVILLGTVGLAALTGYLDVVLFPALAFFIGLTLYALWHKKRRKKQLDARCDSVPTDSRNTHL